MFTNNFKLDGIDSILEDIGYMDEMKGAGEDQEHKYTKKSGKKSKDYDKDGAVEDETDEYAGVKDAAIKKATGKKCSKCNEEPCECDEVKESSCGTTGKKTKKMVEGADFSFVLDELTDEDLLFLSDDLIEEVVEEFFYETLEEGYEIDELETLLIEQVESELTYLEEAKVTVGHDSDVKPEASRTSKLAKVKDAVKKVASGAKAVAKKVAGAAGQVAGSAVAGYKKASAATADRPSSGSSSDDSKSDTANTGSKTPRSSSNSGTKRPGILGRVGAALKSGLKKAIRGAGKAAGKVVKTAKAGYDEGRGKSAPAAKPAATSAAKPAAKKPAAKPTTPAVKTATAKKKAGGNLDNLLNQIRNEATYGGTPKKEEPKDTRMVVTKADKTGNTKAYQNYKAGNKSYKAADHLDEAGKLQGGGKDPCWKGYEMVGMKNKGGREVPNCVPKEEYIDIERDMLEEGYTFEQVLEVIAAYEDGFEVIFEENGVTINETQEVLDEEFLSDVEMVADWLHTEGIIENEDEFFELMEDLSEEEIEELYDVVLSEAEGSYGQTPKARSAMGKLAVSRMRKPASEYSQRGEKTKKLKAAEKHTRRQDRLASGNNRHGSRGPMDQAHRNWSRGADDYGHSGYDGDGYGGSVTKNPKKLRKQKAMGEIAKENYMIGNSLEEGGLEVRNYSWEEVMEATAMAKRGYDETSIRNKIASKTGGGKSADRATKLADKPTYGDSGKQKARENLARKQRGDFRNTTSSSPGLHGYGHKSNDPAVKAKQAARGAQRGALTPNEKKQLGREGYEMIGNSLEEGGLEVRNYSWKEVMESQAARNNPEKYEAGQKKKYAPVRGEKTPMPPRGDKRREDFEKWYAANVR
jgi:hypothetical protein